MPIDGSIRLKLITARNDECLAFVSNQSKYLVFRLYSRDGLERYDDWIITGCVYFSVTI